VKLVCKLYVTNMELTNPALLSRGKQRKSTDKWESALKLALECVAKLNERVTSIEDMENNSTEALQMLTNRQVRAELSFLCELDILILSLLVSVLVSGFTGGVDPKSSDEFQVMARNVVHNKLQSFLTQLLFAGRHVTLYHMI